MLRGDLVEAETEATTCASLAVREFSLFFFG
jgi:hypothetical protein